MSLSSMKQEQFAQGRPDHELDMESACSLAVTRTRAYSCPSPRSRKIRAHDAAGGLEDLGVPCGDARAWKCTIQVTHGRRRPGSKGIVGADGNDEVTVAGGAACEVGGVEPGVDAREIGEVERAKSSSQSRRARSRRGVSSDPPRWSHTARARRRKPVGTPRQRPRGHAAVWPGKAAQAGRNAIRIA